MIFADNACPAQNAQADLGFRCLLTESMDTVVYVDEQRMSRSDCTDAHAHPVFPCSHVA